MRTCLSLSSAELRSISASLCKSFSFSLNSAPSWEGGGRRERGEEGRARREEGGWRGVRREE